MIKHLADELYYVDMEYLIMVTFLGTLICPCRYLCYTDIDKSSMLAIK